MSGRCLFLGSHLKFTHTLLNLQNWGLFGNYCNAVSTRRFHTQAHANTDCNLPFFYILQENYYFLAAFLFPLHTNQYYWERAVVLMNIKHLSLASHFPFMLYHKKIRERFCRWNVFLQSKAYNEQSLLVLDLLTDKCKLFDSYEIFDSLDAKG